MKKKAIPSAAALAAIVMLVSCAGSPEPVVTESAPAQADTAPAPESIVLETSPAQVRLDALETEFASGSVGAFAKANAGDFTTFVLSNGIPVVVKRNDSNRVRSLSLVLRGGSIMTPRADAGIETIMLQTMARGSVGWPYSKLRAKLDETSSGIGAETYFEHSIYTLTTLDKYFDELLPIWASTLLEPAWMPVDFDKVLSNAKLSLKNREKDPWQTTASVMNEEFFGAHPYGSVPEGTKGSLAGMTVEKVAEHYARTFSANRLFVVAVGNYDPDTLRSALERELGGIPDLAVGVPVNVPSFEGRVRARLVKSTFAASKGVGYLRGDFAAPRPTDSDYPAASLAMKMLSDLLFNVVRDKYGAVYSPGSYIRAFGANYGSLVIFKTSVAAAVKGYIDEAVAELASGRVASVAPKPEEGLSPRQDLAEALPVYKALYLGETYEKIGTNAAVAAEIARSVMQFGDPRAWLLDVDRIEAATAEQVLAAARKYLLEAPVTWVVLGSSDVVGPVNEADFTDFRKP